LSRHQDLHARWEEPLVPRLTPPIYTRIEADLRLAIADGAWRAGSRLPSEDALSRRYGVSRMTVRQALAGLASAGLVTKRHGVGTFVRPAKIERVTSRLLGFREDALAHGLSPETRVLRGGIEPVGDEDASLLSLPGDAEVLRVVRLRIADGEPIGLNTVTVVPAFARSLEGLDFHGSFYGGVRQSLGVDIGWAEQTVEAVHGDDAEAQWLGVAATDALLKTTRVTHLADGRLLGLTRSLYRGDRYYLSLALHRSPVPG
jgi:GntR family transcriptional regulator